MTTPEKPSSTCGGGRTWPTTICRCVQLPQYSLRGEPGAGGVEEAAEIPAIHRRANDILRATRRDPLPLSDPGVLRDLQKVLAGEKLSPVLVAEEDIADGYHRVSLAYALDPYADVPVKLG